MNYKLLYNSYLAGLSLLISLVLAGLPLTVSRAAVNPTPAAQISFTFDDGLTSAITKAAPILQKYGIKGTEYVATNCVGSNRTCPVDKTSSFMTWNQIKNLKSTYGWEIGGHTMNHYPLTTLTDTQKEREISGGKQALAAQGITATSFASPQGDYDQRTLELVAKYFNSHRGFHDKGMNTWPYSDYLIRVQQVQAGVSVDQVKAYIDQAIANSQWLVLVFHDIKTSPSINPQDYQYSDLDLDRIAAYTQAKRTAGLISTKKVSDALVTNSTNMFANGGFTNGITNGWTTDTPQGVVADTAGNGSFPNAANAVKFTSLNTSAHLFSPQVAVNRSTKYLFKNYLTVRQISSGEVGFYIDEYDVSGNWVSGQWKGSEPTRFTESFNFAYQPTSAAVTQARLQIYASGNSGITAYIDNVRMFELESVVVPPTTNLVGNGSFDAGLTGGWTTTTAANAVADSANNGSPANPINSISMVSNSTTGYLFGPAVSVAAATTYSITTFCSITAIVSGEVGFYIDEYDANGNWVSGQWKTARTTVGSSSVAVAYRPTSTNVATAKLQIYATGAGIQGYIDDVRWYAL